MKPEKKTKRRSETPKLTRDDWLDAAFKAAAEGGFENVRVLVIADTLRVTRGSFYWHFTDHADLINALLARWREQERELESEQRLNSQSTKNPSDDLLNLLETALAYAGPDLANMRFELALRDLGCRDQEVANMLVEVDRNRMTLFEHKFQRLTGNPKKSAELATLFYLVIAGSSQALSRQSNPPQVKDYLKGLIANHFIHQQRPTAARKPRSGTKPG